jgi:hypothetical protein
MCLTIRASLPRRPSFPKEQSSAMATAPSFAASRSASAVSTLAKYSARLIAKLIEKAKLIKQHNPAAFEEESLSDTLSLSDVAENRRAFINRLLGGEQIHGPSQDFPWVSSSADLQGTWSTSRQHLLENVSPGHITPLPEKGSCIFL